MPKNLYRDGTLEDELEEWADIVHRFGGAAMDDCTAHLWSLA
jgi:hypothetical protein